jgi:hypothetical protein
MVNISATASRLGHNGAVQVYDGCRAVLVFVSMAHTISGGMPVVGCVCMHIHLTRTDRGNAIPSTRKLSDHGSTFHIGTLTSLFAMTLVDSSESQCK